MHIDYLLNAKLKRVPNETAVSLTKRMRDGQCERVRVNEQTAAKLCAENVISFGFSDNWNMSL